MASVMHAAPQTMITVQVPDGAPPGTLVQFNDPSGQPIQVQIPPGLGPGAQFTIAVPAPRAHAPSPSGPVVLVDHLVTVSCNSRGGAHAFAGYVADDVHGAGARPAFALELTYAMIMQNMQGQCCQNPYQGLVIPVYLSSVDGRGGIADHTVEAAQLHLDGLPKPCSCNAPSSARVLKDGVAYPLVSQGGAACCPTCCPDADMTVGQHTLKGVTFPACMLPFRDVPLYRAVAGEPDAGMHRALFVPGASGPGRSPIQHQRMPCCYCPGGPPVAVESHSIKLPRTKDSMPAEVWFASAIFEHVVYPYRGGGGGGDGGGGPRAETMAR
jgi:hypothetical protein